MHSDNQVSTFLYDSTDFIIIVKSYEENKSRFDSVLWQKWKHAEETQVFRYTLNIKSSKMLKGKCKFLAQTTQWQFQLNPERGQQRRVPETIMSMSQPFDPNRFNFTKLMQQEILFDIGNGSASDIIAINSSPLEQGHCLLITERFKCLPQIITEYSILKAIELCLLSNSWSLRIAFNSLCAHASVNHLHWHLYYLKNEMLLEYIDVCDYTSGVHLLVDYPAKGFCIKLSNFKNIKKFVSRTFLLINYLQQCEVAHNVYITRAKSKSSDKLYDDIRIYIWARKPSYGVKHTTTFIPAVCELFGHLSIRSENMYNDLKEDDVSDIFKNLTYESFLLIKDKLQHFLEKNVNDMLEVPPH